jgi:hypothetical protein
MTAMRSERTIPTKMLVRQRMIISLLETSDFSDRMELIITKGIMLVVG